MAKPIEPQTQEELHPERDYITISVILDRALAVGIARAARDNMRSRSAEIAFALRDYLRQRHMERGQDEEAQSRRGPAPPPPSRGYGP